MSSVIRGKIDWSSVIESNNITREEFEEEVILTAMAILELQLESHAENVEGVVIDGGGCRLMFTKNPEKNIARDIH